MLSTIRSLLSCGCCGASSDLSLNGRQLKIVRLLGEGGMAYVYLVEDEFGEQYALKKINCPFGADSVAAAMAEIEAMRVFAKSQFVVNLVDSAVVSQSNGSKIVFELLPFYKNGTLQQLIDNAAVSESFIPEERVCELALATCHALRPMHLHRSQSSEPDAQINTAYEQESPGEQLNELEPWAHRDIKPANLLLSSSSEVVLTDLGSAIPARIKVENNKQALSIQEKAAEQCTLPYRAPELLNVRRGTQLTEQVDIWSVGCTVYALMYGCSPFEHEELVAGANLNMAILGGKFRFPATPVYSENLKSTVSQCLNLDPEQRPRIDDLVHLFSASHS